MLTAIRPPATVRPPAAPRPQAPAPLRPQGLREFPGSVPAWRWVLQAIGSGQEALLPGTMPAYPTIPAAEKQAAIARGAGRTVPQPMNSADAAGKSLNDPINLVVKGSKEALVAAFERQGWVLANRRTPWSYMKVALSALTRLFNDVAAPVTGLYLDGKSEDFAFNKNCDYNWARDHFRVYHRGQDPATGEDVWAIAGTRDTALSLTVHHRLRLPTFAHAIDPEIDGERDLIMHDLLASGAVADWALVSGRRPPDVHAVPLPDGRWRLDDHLVTDGRVYEVRLKN